MYYARLSHALGPDLICRGDRMADTQTEQRVPSDGWQDGRGNATISDVQVPLLLLADFANQTAEGKLNILGVFGEIACSSFPAMHAQMAVIAQFSANRNESGTYKVTVRMVDQDGSKVFDATGEMEVPDVFEEKLMNQVFVIKNLIFQKAGEYSVVALINGEERNSYRLVVRKLEGTVQHD
jgi:hypothetical protein